MKLDNNFKPKLYETDYGWHLRKLPHLDAESTTQFVTFRLCDSMPQTLLEKWRKESDDDARFRKRIESFLDSGHGVCWLKETAVAEMIAETLKFHEGKKYRLHAWVIMPNHGHLLLTPLPGVHLPSVMHSIKSYTAQMANKILKRKGQFWQHESFDRYIRDSRHFNAVVRYIENNPVKAGLCESAVERMYGSAYDRHSRG